MSEIARVMESNHHRREIREVFPESYLEKLREISGVYYTDNDEDSVWPRRRRVAAYARVSTEQEEQAGSFLAQVAFYTNFITKRPDWQLVKVYADKGLSGTSYKHRPGFAEMIADARAGKIDLILTKSISRFARNTVDSLSITRELKDLGVEIKFEKENISSFDPKAEMIFTILSSFAQEESRSISENVRWANKRRMEAGKSRFSYKNFLGYERDEDGEPRIVEEEARVVRKIYQLFLDGESYAAIVKRLTDEGVLSPSCRLVWSPGSVRKILTNEKYKGDEMLGKTYVADYLTKQVKVNHGERERAYIRDAHDAIISPEVFDRVQKEIEKRKRRKK